MKHTTVISGAEGRKNSLRRKAAFLSVLLALMTLLAACGSKAGGNYSASQAAYSPAYDSMAEGKEVAEEYSRNLALAPVPTKPASSIAAPEAPAPVPSPVMESKAGAETPDTANPAMAETSAASPENQPEETLEDSQPVMAGVKLVYNAGVNIQTLEYEETIAAVKEAVTLFSGIIQQQNEYSGDVSYRYRGGNASGSLNRTCSFVIRIPAARFYEFMDQVQGIGVVTDKNINVSDITRSYYQTSAMVEALKKEESRLLEMMDQASTIEEMIAVEQRLSQVEMDLQSYQTSLAGMDLEVEYSTISLSVREVERIQETPQTSFSTRIRNALEESGENFTSFFQDFVVDAILYLPVLLFLAVLILIFVLIIRGIRRRIRRRREKKEAKKKASSDGPAQG